MQALVTGASGFIGPHLVKQLVEQGDEVTCLVRKSSDISRLDRLNPKYVYGDVLDPVSLEEAISECDVVYHLAGLTKSVPPRVMWRVNETGVRNIAQACAGRAVAPTLIVLSSLAAAGPAPPGRPLTESDSPQPVSKYGVSKLKGEQAALEFSEVVPISIVRSPIVFGQGDLDGLALFSCIAKARLHTSPTFRRHRYSFIHAADLGKAMSLVASKGERLSSAHTGRGIYFAAAEKNPNFAEYGHMIADAMGINLILTLPIPPMAIRLSGGSNELLSRLTGRAHILNWDKTREALAGSWACSPERLNRDLGFRTDLPFEDRLVQTVRWYVDQGHLPPRVLKGCPAETDANPAA